MMSAGRRLHPAWANYRRRRLVAFLLFVGYLPAVLAIAIPLKRVTGSDEWMAAVAFCWMAAWGFSIIRLGSFRCPRCGKGFHVSGMFGNPLARNCLHCRLPKWADPG